MSRGSRGGRGGGRGGRGGFGGPSALPPMGLTFAEIQNLSREATALYPPVQVPVLTEYTEDEKKIAQLQMGFASRLRNSAYYIVEKSKSNELPRYSDKYRPSIESRPGLRRKDLHAPFFPTEIFEGYFNPKKRAKAITKDPSKPRVNLDDLADGSDDQEKSSDERSDAGSQGQSDYDVDEEYDNDYAENYFDNGEGDDMDDLGGGGAGDDGPGGGGDYD